ncbi:MAG: hypothetical protein HY914_23060 [Desulfomonile tiedjei]|nr:hypothetical protein [Desulfomonile tiedjei]
MKRLCVVLMGVVMFWVAPAGAFAQGYVGYQANPGLTGFLFPRLSGMVSGCDQPQPGVIGTPRIYFGWLEHPNGATWALQRVASTGTAAWPLKGFWLQATDDFMFRDGLGLSLSGSVFFPQRSAGTWSQSPPIGGSVDFEVPSYEWCSLDALVTQRISGSFQLIAGFRWDHTSTRVDYSDNTSDDYIMNEYIPFIGAQVNQPTSLGSVLVRFVGTPLVPGSIRYHFWTNTGFAEFGNFDVSQGYFMELLAEYRLRIACDLSLGGFAKWNALHVQTATRNLAGSVSEPISWVVDIRSWTVGGSVSLGFASPF